VTVTQKLEIANKQIEEQDKVIVALMNRITKLELELAKQELLKEQ